MKVLVTGSKGQLGSEINKIASKYTYNWIFTNHNDFNLCDLNRIFNNLDVFQPDIIINCCAYTAVDDAENNKHIANVLNHEAIKHIAKWSNYNNCKLIHISTDYVYDGSSKFPLTENAKTNPLNNYGKTKLLGDIACSYYAPESIIIRTSWLYSSFGNNFVKQIISLMQQKKEIFVVNDQIGSPTYAADLAQVILNIIYNKTWKPGIYNYSNEAKISWFEFANDIKAISNTNTIISPVESKFYKTKAKRPKYSLLDKSKIKNTFNVIINPYMDSLISCMKLLKNEI